MAKSTAFAVLFFFLPVFSSAAQAEDPLSDPAELIKNAAAQMKIPDRKKSDFYASRYLGLCEKASCPDVSFKEFLKIRQLEPKAFVPDEWDAGFLEWFEKSVLARWAAAPERIREKKRSFEISHTSYENRYFATVVAYPELELWHVLDDGLVSRPMVLAMGSFRARPALYFGKIVRGASVHSGPVHIDTKKRTLHYVWKPEFFDLDGDGKPELWLRFNIAWGNGFAQVLEIYKIREDKIVLLERFEGLPDGFARRLPDGRVEVATSVRAEQKTHTVETWQYIDKEFMKIDKKQRPFVLKSPDWKGVFTGP